jgi:hypothetical protein
MTAAAATAAPLRKPTPAMGLDAGCTTSKRNAARLPTSLTFLAALRWLDGRPLLDTIEPYRRTIFTKALDTFRPDGSPVYNMVLAGRAKKNAKSLDLVLAGLYCLVIRRAPQGNSGYIVASDEDQAGDDLDLAKKLVAANPQLAAEIEVLSKELRLRDGSGSLRILPGQDVAGTHGKTGGFVGFDEIHTQRTWDLLEALQPDPTRRDALTWITSYDTIYNTVGTPLYDLKVIGRAGDDPRMLFSWYSGDLCTDPRFADLEPELRANPSVRSWPEGRGYLAQQKRRLPTSKYRRLHLNLPGAPTGAYFDQGSVLAAIVAGRKSLPPERGKHRYVAFVDMSGGSSDDACLCIAHAWGGRAVVDLVVKQAGPPPFNPRVAVAKFVGIMREFGLTTATADDYGGQTFKADFAAHGARLLPCPLSTSDLYEELEPRINAGEIELPDMPILQEQFLTLVVKGSKITHQSGDHDDHANAVAGAVWLTLGGPQPVIVPKAAILRGMLEPRRFFRGYD